MDDEGVLDRPSPNALAKPICGTVSGPLSRNVSYLLKTVAVSFIMMSSALPAALADATDATDAEEVSTQAPVAPGATPATPAKPSTDDDDDSEDAETAPKPPKAEPVSAAQPAGQPPTPIEELVVGAGALLEKRELLLKSMKTAKSKGVGTAPFAAEFLRIEDSVKNQASESDLQKKLDSLLDTIAKQIAKQNMLKTQTPSATGSKSGGRNDDMEPGHPGWERIHNPPGNREACAAAEAAGTIHVLDYNVLMFQGKDALYTRSERIIGAGHRFDAWNESVKLIAYQRMNQMNEYLKTVPGVLGVRLRQAGLAIYGQPYTVDMTIIYDARSKNIRPMIAKLQKDYHLVLFKCADKPLRYMPVEPMSRSAAQGNAPASTSRSREDHFSFDADYYLSRGWLR